MPASEKEGTVLVIHTHIVCDGCSASFGETETTNTGSLQRENARKAGWQYSGSKDMCPNCRPRRKDGELHSTMPKRARRRYPVGSRWEAVEHKEGCRYFIVLTRREGDTEFWQIGEVYGGQDIPRDSTISYTSARDKFSGRLYFKRVKTKPNGSS